MLAYAYLTPLLFNRQHMSSNDHVKDERDCIMYYALHKYMYYEYTHTSSSTVCWFIFRLTFLCVFS